MEDRNQHYEAACVLDQAGNSKPKLKWFDVSDSDQHVKELPSDKSR
jgi:hypothetical protein